MKKSKPKSHQIPGFLIENYSYHNELNVEFKLKESSEPSNQACILDTKHANTVLFHQKGFPQQCWSLDSSPLPCPSYAGQERLQWGIISQQLISRVFEIY